MVPVPADGVRAWATAEHARDVRHYEERGLYVPLDRARHALARSLAAQTPPPTADGS